MNYVHNEPFRPVHDRIPYSAIIDRAPIVWPGTANVAVWVIPNIEHYEYLPIDGSVDPYPRTPHPDVRKFAYHDYGNRVGFWRLLDVFDRYQVPATVSLNVAVLDHYPEIAEAMKTREWEFMCHGLYNTRYLTGMTRHEECDFVGLCNDVLRRHTGEGFSGMLGPNITGNTWTPDVMAKHGMIYHADWVHDELPTPLEVDSSHQMVALPYSYELNDAPILMRSSLEGPGYARRCIAQFEKLKEEADKTGAGRLMALPLHPFAIGQPHRISFLDQIMARLRSSDAWIATGSDIVRHYLAQIGVTDDGAEHD